MASSSYELFAQEAPEAFAAFNGLIGSMQNGGLDAKTMQLVYIGMKACQGGVGAVTAHVPMAKKAGASWEEIRHTLVLTLTVCGVSGLLACLGPAKAAFDAC